MIVLSSEETKTERLYNSSKIRQQSILELKFKPSLSQAYAIVLVTPETEL